MSQEQLTGAEWLARSLAANGTTHVFFIDAVLRRTPIELDSGGRSPQDPFRERDRRLLALKQALRRIGPMEAK